MSANPFPESITFDHFRDVLGSTDAQGRWLFGRQLLSSIVVSGADTEGEPIEQELHVSRIGRSLRAGWPQAKLGLSVYFREWEHSEFPARFAVTGTDGVTSIDLDASGALAVDRAENVVWSAPWEKLTFSNGNDVVLGNGSSTTIRIEIPDGEPDLEEILIKYGTFRQMHF